MDNHLHLSVLHDNVDPIQDSPIRNVTLYNPKRHDFRWNDDYTAFRPVSCRWWDDASYIAWQCGEGD